MSSYIAILYTSQGPVFAATATISEAQAFLSQWISQQPLRSGEAVAIITADTEQVVYFHNLTRVRVFFETLCRPLTQAKQLLINYLLTAKAA